MSQPQLDPIAMLASLVRDIDKRLTKVERALWMAAGASLGTSGTWITIAMTRR